MALLQSTLEDGGQPLLPPHPHGDAWQFVMLFGDHQQAVADTASELLSLVIDGYGSIVDDQSAFLARLDHAIAVSAGVQHSVVASAIDGGYQLDDDDVTTALLSNKGQPLRIPPESWDQPVALILVATHYAPYTDTPAPSGELVMLVDPSSEKEYLSALDALGLLTFRELNLA
ncbi:hypothetical protein FB459_2164 [Yimella lutea]|uniref:Uncharacterized protein n=1 Tax=Yimella lutea TaxID=587872 RepID=A0A542EHG7_9MICO|nr:hypothetical protein [Yimella lutea]TQJ14666.1 hypothetical protein FB459_2164 [Yimella lutea]